jgi:hypothetical protein
MPESNLKWHRAGHTLTAAELAKIDASLADVDWRLMHWLLRYPLQRADDLVVGVARWTSRATVYRHLQALEARELLESVPSKTPGTGKCLYFLSNPGLHLLARHMNTPARKLARTWKADDAGLLRVLPRLPTLLMLQEVVNGLVTCTAEAMTTQGRRPKLVRWTWQRDIVHRFQYRDQVLRLCADGMVALCIRSQQGDGSTLDRWYGLFLLSTELDDERLMCLRTERLLCWRESPERWSSYQHMPPVLILARSQRQCEHWQRAVERVALKLRLEPLAGALACPPPHRANINPWVFSWRTPPSALSCHLQDLLRPLPRSVFPPSLRLEDGEEERDIQPQPAASVPTVSSGTPTRLGCFIVGDLARRATNIRRDEPEEQEVIALLGVRLTPCQWGILYLLLAHPLLSDEELAALLSLQRRSVRCSLYSLHQLGCLEPITTKVGKRWHLCGRGLRLISAASHTDIRNFAVLFDDEATRGTSVMMQRGEAWLLLHMQHTAGIYGFFAALAQAARGKSGQALSWWETGAVCERRYRVHERWYNFRPDALAEYGVGQEQLRFWLEWDCGTMNVRDLAIKFTSYAHYIASREWAREHPMLPELLCVAPDIAQERRMHRVAQAKLTHTPGLMMWTTTVVLLSELSLLAPIWLQALPQRCYSAHEDGSLRQGIFDGMFGKKGVC